MPELQEIGISSLGWTDRTKVSYDDSQKYPIHPSNLAHPSQHNTSRQQSKSKKRILTYHTNYHCYYHYQYHYQYHY
jgi:hypothetical protein